MAETESPTYRFKWSNYDLNRYLKDRRYKADALRRDAHLILKQADQIEEEARDLEQALLPAEPT